MPSLVEIFGVVTGILYVILEVRQNRWLWPLGVLTSAVYIYVFYQGKFYADMGLQGYYVLISIYGWIHWSRGAGESKNLPVSQTPRKWILPLALVFLLAWAGIWLILLNFTDSPVPVGDSFTTALAIVATWMLARKWIEHWYLWIIANAVSVALYLYKGLHPTVVLYVVYSGMAIIGLSAWRKSRSKT